MDIQESLSRILDSRDSIGDMFYKVFLDRYPEMQRHFIGVDMQRQAIVLTTSLMVVEQYYRQPRAAMEMYLQYLGARHRERGISKELYSQWVDAMLVTMETFHGEAWNEELADQWRRAFDRAIQRLFDGYGQT